MLKNTGAFLGKTVFVTGGSRGIGKAIVLKIAQDGANVVIAAKTTEPHPKLEGTIYTAAKEVENAGGKCLPLQCDLRDEEAVNRAITQAAEKFGKIDILINNASAISLTKTEETIMKKYDLMNQVNVRGTFITSKYALPHLKNSSNPHILNISPPLEMKPLWFSQHVAYTISKYGMSMCVLGMAEEYRDQGIAVNALWPRTTIWTAATNMLAGGFEDMATMCRKADILADSAYAILSKDSKTCTGNFFIDEEVLRKEGITDFKPYAIKPGAKLLADFFIPEHLSQGLLTNFGKNIENSSIFTGSKTSEIMEIFRKIQSKITDDLKDDINAVLLFIVSGKNYLLDIHSSKPLKVEMVNDSKQKCDLKMITDEDTFFKIVRGEVKPSNAFMSGKFKISGNVTLAMKIAKLFKVLQSNK